MKNFDPFEYYESKGNEIRCRCTECGKTFLVHFGSVRESRQRNQFLTCSSCGTKTLKPVPKQWKVIKDGRSQ